MRYQHIDLGKKYKYHIDYVRVLGNYVFADIKATIYYLTDEDDDYYDEDDDEPIWAHYIYYKTVYFMIKPPEQAIEISPKIIYEEDTTLVDDILHHIQQTYMGTYDILDYAII